MLKNKLELILLVLFLILIIIIFINIRKNDLANIYRCLINSLKGHKNGGCQSAVTYEKKEGLLIKKFYDVDDFNTEFNILKILEKYNIAPKIIDYNKKDLTIKINYIGEPISKKNYPKDWLQQIKVIKNIFKKENIYHNDLKLEHILVKNKKIYIIDFGISTNGKRNHLNSINTHSNLLIIFAPIFIFIYNLIEKPLLLWHRYKLSKFDKVSDILPKKSTQIYSTSRLSTLGSFNL